MSSKKAKQLRKALREKGFMEKGEDKKTTMKEIEKVVWVTGPDGQLRLQKVKTYVLERQDTYAKAKKLIKDGKFKI